MLAGWLLMRRGGLLFLSLILSVVCPAQERPADEVVSARPFLRWDRQAYRNRGLSYASQVSGVVQSDPLLYQDSYVSETYLEARLNPWSTREVRLEGPHRVPDWTRYGPTDNQTVLRALPNDLQTIISKLTLCPLGVFGALTRGPKRCLILPILLPENLIFGRPAGGHRA